jgi:hypothetical protein
MGRISAGDNGQKDLLSFDYDCEMRAPLGLVMGNAFFATWPYSCFSYTCHLRIPARPNGMPDFPIAGFTAKWTGFVNSGRPITNPINEWPWRLSAIENRSLLSLWQLES